MVEEASLVFPVGSRIQRAARSQCVSLSDRVLLAGKDEAFDHNSSGFKMRYLMVGTVSHEDGLSKKKNKGAGLIRKPTICSLIPVDDQIVGHVAFGAEKRRFQPAWKGAERQLAHGIGAGTNSCNLQVHLLRRLSPGFLGVAGRVGLKFMDED
jgi:hypothetical protein